MAAKRRWRRAPAPHLARIEKRTTLNFTVYIFRNISIFDRNISRNKVVSDKKVRIEKKSQIKRKVQKGQPSTLATDIIP